MNRKMLRFGVSALAVLPSAAIALGLGPIEVKSSLDQPLSARIPVLAAEPEQLEKLAAGLATREHFETVGVERVPVLSQLTFELIRPEGARPYIVVESKAPIREPLLDMLVEVNWPGGTLLREYSLFLDPPGRTVRATPAVAASTTRSTTSSPRATAPPPRVVPQPRRAGTFSGSSYGPVEPGETLWSIAEQVRPDRSVSVQQMMLAILDANPRAFWSNNVNSLNKGAILRVPTRAEIVVRSKRDAVAEASRQWKEWQANPSPYTQVAKAEEPTPTPSVEAPATELAEAEVPLHQVLLVPTAEDETPIDSEAEPASRSALASAASEGVTDGLGVPVEAQPLVRVESGGLGLRLAGLDGLSERLPAIIAVDNSVLATGAVGEVIDGRLGETLVDESAPTSVESEESSASSSDESGTATATDSTMDGESATGTEASTLAVVGEMVEQVEIEVAVGSQTDPDSQSATIVEPFVQASADEASSATVEVVSPPVAATARDQTGLESDSTALSDAGGPSVLPDLDESPVVESSVSETALDVADSMGTATTSLEPSPITDVTARGESSVAGKTLLAQGPGVALESADPGVSDAPDSAPGEEPKPATGEESTLDLEAQSSADATAESEIQADTTPQLDSDADVRAPTAELEPPAQVDPTSALPPALLGLSSLLEEPRNLAIAGGVAILFLVLLMLLVRRAANSREAVEQPRKSKRTAPMAPVTAAEAETDSRDEARVDPMKQADVLVAVGNCAEAGRIIADAMAASPDDDALAFKQLEVDYAAHDEAAFAAHAMESRARLEANGLWANAVAMGVVLCADNPMFAGDSESETVNSEAAKPADIVPPPPLPGREAATASNGDSSDLSPGRPVGEDALRAMSLGGSDDRTEPTLGSVDIPADDGNANVLEFEAASSSEADGDSDSESDAFTESVDELILTDEDGFFSPVDEPTGSDDGDLGDALEAEFEKLELEGLGDIGESSLASKSEANDKPVSEYDSLDFGDFAVADADLKQASGASPSAAVEGAVSTNPSSADEGSLEPEWAAGTGASSAEQTSSFDVEGSPIAFEDEQGDPTFVETKLDLAAAYLELGDDAGARTLYEEVLSEGSVSQKQLADEALRKLA